MTRTTTSGLFLTFTLPSSGVINITNSGAVITALYKEVALVLGRSYTTSTDLYLDDDRVGALVQQRASEIMNQWYEYIVRKQGSSPSFTLSKDNIKYLKALPSWSFRFASYEDIPYTEVGDSTD